MKRKILISGGHIITMNPLDKIYENGWILIEDDVIMDVGTGDLPEIEGEYERIDAKGKAVMPGIVNIHTHVCGSLFKALTEDRVGSFYGLAFPMERFLTPETTYALSMLGCIETVKFGSTCINDIFQYMRSTAKAVEEIGLRGVLAQKIYEVNLGNLQNNDYSRIPGEGERRLEENIRLIEEYHGKANGRITCRFGPHATDTVSLELAKKISRLAEEYKLGVHTHVAQKVKEIEYLRETYNLSPVEFLEETGLAGKKLISAHCVLVDDNDIRILKETQTNVAHCAEMMMKRGNFPPMKEFYAEELRIALGTDWVTMNPWTNMRFAIGGARLRGCNEDEMNAKKAFRMATIGAAEIIGMDENIGSLEVGKKADLIMMNLDYANMKPIFDDIIATIVYNATGREIDTVMIDGQIIVKDGEVTTVDEATVAKEACDIAHDFYNRQLANIETV